MSPAGASLLSMDGAEAGTWHKGSTVCSPYAIPWGTKAPRGATHAGMRATGLGTKGEHPIPIDVTREGCWHLTALPPPGVFPCWLTGQAGGAAGHADQQEHHPVPGGVQGLPGTAALQEEEGS